MANNLYNYQMVMDSFRRAFVALSLFALMIAAPPATAFAQEQQAQVATPQTTAAERMNDEEVTILRDDFAGKYNLSTLPNLSKLYWRLGAFDTEDLTAVGNFVKINDCKIFMEYINDDLEWKEILNVMKDHIEKNHASYPLNFQFVLELHLGRYDPEQGGFPVVDKTGFIDAKRIEVDSIDNNKEICFDSNPIQDYPKTLVALLDKPFTFNFLKLDEHVAQAYILRKKSEYSALSEDQRMKSYERPAYLRLRMTFSQYHGNLMSEAGTPSAIVYGTIDGYEVFEDSKQKRLMLSVDLKKPQDQGAAPEPAATPAPAAETAAPAAALTSP